MTISEGDIDRVVATIGTDELDEGLLDTLGTVVEKSGAAVLGGGKSSPKMNPDTMSYLSTIGTQKITMINEVTRAAIRSTLLEGIETGESIPKLAKRIRAVFSAATAVRAKTIARTEALGAMNYGREKGMQTLGVTWVQWMATLDSRTRPDHKDLNGQVRRLGESFTVGDASATRPGDFGVPEQDINCRCVLVPVTQAEAEEAGAVEDGFTSDAASGGKRIRGEVEKADRELRRYETIIKRAVVRAFHRQYLSALKMLKKVGNGG